MVTKGKRWFNGQESVRKKIVLRFLSQSSMTVIVHLFFQSDYHSADDMDPEFLEWPISFGVSGYVALYRLQQDVALVVAVRHQREVGYHHR